MVQTLARKKTDGEKENAVKQRQPWRGLLGQRRKSASLSRQECELQQNKKKRWRKGGNE